ncbi:HAMP domain-containing histidine kinase [Enterococcus sp. BWB1-3]|uniref:sensor histidine kinase n=1 Tax=unclassified Enterococcus TaxID=2608891 RepID=UPI0019225960|nr:MULTISPECIES: HAMP domain-containing sensor histidine kinase [unclassified Enterococcus]MBL1230937.1 HAMP domain-containing histidine kinase [Enterococcus sp. BWB1-3]MCB5950715.1 HAMP domain-containing histidine kinase [Enterococcus sp. BWT-B8]
MKEQRTKNQRIRYFVVNMISFSSIFLILGIIVFQLLQTSIYQSVDTELTRMSENDQFLNMQIKMAHFDRFGQLPQNDPIIGNGNNSEDKIPPKNSFQQQVILWTAEGEIINEDSLGSRYDDLQNVKLSTESLNTINSITVKDSNERVLQFRSITVPIIGDETSDVAYVQILTNTDPIKGTIERVKQILIVCMVVFGVLSIILSYFLSKWSMKPIMVSWAKQLEFVENASHELRTPLTIIQAKLEKLFTKPNHTILEESETIAASLTEVQRLSELTSDLLLLARSDSNAVILDKETVNIKDFLLTSLTPYQELAEAENKELKINIEKEGQAAIDRQKIKQLLIILLDNALKYTNEGDQVLLSSKVERNEWIINVVDQGIGIEDEQKKEIFDRFYRGDQSRNRKTGGYGIGLAIAKWIAESHHGKISVSDTTPKGTTFTVILPIK